MAYVRFISPFIKIAGTESLHLEAKNVRQLCEKLMGMFGSGMGMLLDQQGNVSQNIVLLVNRRNVHTMDGADTVLSAEAEVIIMPYIGGG